MAGTEHESEPEFVRPPPTPVALVQAREAVAAARDAGDADAHIAALVELTSLERQYGHSARAVQAGVESLRLMRTAPPAADAIEVHLWLAEALSELQLDSEALQHAREAFDLARVLSLYRPAVQALMVLGGLHGRMGEHELAQHLMMQALSRARESNDAALIRSALNNLVATMTGAEDHRRTTEGTPMPSGPRSMIVVHARRLLAGASQELTAYRREAMMCTAAAGLMAAEFFDEARGLLESCASLAAAEGLHASHLKTLGNLGQLHVRNGDLGAARHAFEAGLRLCPRVDSPVSEGALRQELAEVCAALGDAPAAQAHAEAAGRLNGEQAQRLHHASRQIDADREAVRAGLERLDADLAFRRVP